MAAKKTNKDIAAEWRSAPVSPYTWTPCPDQTGVETGEAGGYRVEAVGFDRLCYLKPANPHGDELQHCRAAREKIASDLAYDLGINLPPAQLTIRLNPPAGATAHVVVTLIQYPKQWPWSVIKTAAIDESPLGAAFAQALSRCSAQLPFDVWTDQQDHNDHPSNIVWGYDPQRLAESAIVFLDYANSMGYSGSWAGNGWQAVTKPGWMPLMLQHLDSEVVLATVVKIEQFAEDKIKDVVNRISDEYLPGARKAEIIAGLIGRRPSVRGALANEIQAIGA